MANLLNAGRKSSKVKLETGFTSIVPLANPKGVEKQCEMCSLPARMCCQKCGVTYYCSNEHRHQDTSHSSLCLRLRTIRGKTDSAINKMGRLRDLAQRNLVTASLLEETFCNAVENLYGVKLNLKSLAFTLIGIMICLLEIWSSASLQTTPELMEKVQDSRLVRREKRNGFSEKKKRLPKERKHFK